MKLCNLPDSVILYILDYIQDISKLLVLNRKYYELIQSVVDRFLGMVQRRDLFLIKVPVAAATDCEIVVISNSQKVQFFNNYIQPKVLFIGGTQEHRKCDLFDVRSGVFKKSRSLNFKRDDEFDAILHLGLVFAISGSQQSSLGRVECYNSVQNIWIEQLSLPRALVSMSSATFRGNLYVIGGNDAILVCDMGVIRCLYSFVSLPHSYCLSFHSTGGYDIRGNNRSSDVYRLTEDVLVHSEDELSSTNAHSSDMWPKCAVALRTGRSHHSCITFNDKIWVVAGVTRDSVYASNQVELLDPVIGTSEVGPSLNKPRFSPHLLILDGILYCIGGDMIGPIRSIGSIEKFNPFTNSWQYVTSFPTKRTKGAIFGYGSRIYLFGGSNAACPETMTTWDFYCTRTHRWASTAQTPSIDGHHLVDKLSSFQGRDKGINCTKAVVMDYAEVYR